MVALLELCFQHYMTPGMIFNKYALWLEDKQQIYKEYVGTRKMKKFLGTSWIQVLKYSPSIIIGKLAKPLGLCPYCNGTWIAIVVFIYIFGFDWTIFLFIGIVWFFIYTLKMKYKY